jgi:RNA polymerase sigma-70 factor (ECF subfamily)
MQHAATRAPSSIDGNTPDTELAQRAAAGEAAAFEAIMRRHNRRLFRTARSILKSDAESEDALQDAYLHAWRALGGFRAEARLSTWLVRIVANEALARLRRKSLPLVSLDDAMAMPGNPPENPHESPFADEAAAAPDSLALRTQLRQLMEARIDRLPDAFRSVFMLRAVEEMSVEEVAQALAIPAATVRTRYFRARQLMRESLAGEFGAALGEAFAFDGSRCDRIVAGVLARGRGEGLAKPL